MSTATATHDDHHDHGPAKGLMRWVTTTNHKDIGTLYLLFALVMFFLGGAMAMVIRAELFQPGLQVVDPQFFNSMTTVHALLMIFGAVMPAFTGLANWLIPMMIGAPDMASRMNNSRSGFCRSRSRCCCRPSSWPAVPGGRLDLYLPLFCRWGRLPVHDLRDHLPVFRRSWAINIVVTILNMRAPGMTLMKMPLFVWTWLITAYLLIAHAGPRRCRDHAADRQVRRHQFLQCRRRW